jgi:hypothetical protein
MIIWIDAHLSPAIAFWITSTFGIRALKLLQSGEVLVEIRER